MLKKEKSSPYAFKIFDFNKKAPLVGPCMRSLGTHRKQKDRKALFLCGEGSVRSIMSLLPLLRIGKHLMQPSLVGTLKKRPPAIGYQLPWYPFA